jgi:CubicO group peptidase (beta-lactamase class C family)
MLARLIQETGTAGAVAVVTRDGRTEDVEAVGIAVRGGRRMTEETMFEGASLSKPVFATHVVGLALSGHLDLPQRRPGAGRRVGAARPA